MREDEKRDRTVEELREDLDLRRRGGLRISAALDCCSSARDLLLLVSEKPYSLGEGLLEDATALLRRSRSEVEKEIEACKEKIALAKSENEARSSG